MPAVTILGARGFVGGELRGRLEADGHEPFCPDKGDEAMFHEPLGIVFDCAGLTADYAARPFDTVEAHANLVAQLAARATFDKLIVLSSTRLYDASQALVAHEDDPLTLNPAEPRQIYDLSKALGENIALTQTQGRGSVARLANVFDWTPGAPGFLSEWLVRAASTKAFMLNSSPHVARDYVYLDDVVDALLAMAGADQPGIVNVASGELLTNDQIADVFRMFGWEVEFARDDAPPPPPCADIAKLRDLGVHPRSALEVVQGYLETLG
ncbi:MAG TPA: NAD(P)-dependent oxidoreductase [Phenylobacterium sp.]